MHALCVNAILWAALSLTHLTGLQDKNAPWRGDDVRRMVEQLESPARPVFRQRERLAALVSAKKGSVVADIGAGSGFMSELFARQVGPSGTVYAVEVNPGLVAYLTNRMRERGLSNVRPVLTREDSVDLPLGSVDLAFLCLTYRFMENPRASLAGIRDILRSGGELVIVEAEDAEIGGRKKLIREVTGDGLEFLRAEPSPFLPSDYVVLRFRKP